MPNITGDVATLTGAEHTPRNPAALWIESSLPVIPVAGTTLIAGLVPLDIAGDGTFSVEGLPASTGGVPLYRLRIVSLSLREAGTPELVTGWFPLTANRDLSWIVANYVPVTVITEQVALDVAAAAALGPTNDTATASYVANTGSATRTALAAAFANKATQTAVEGRLAEATLNATYARTSGRPINAGDHGVTTAVADISVPLNALITANPGRKIVVPPGTYTTKADNGSPSSGYSGGIALNQARTTLDLTGVTIQMQASSSQHYQIIDIAAADVTVLGGRLIGDVGSHVGTIGEFGHGVSIGAGAHRAKVVGTYVTKCWGDGIFVWDDPSDVSIIGCTADDNRRQGLSIIDSRRTSVIGGHYINTGVTSRTAPAAGIDVEPDPGTSRDVVDCLIVGVTASKNTGPGIMASANGRTCSGLIVSCIATENGGFIGGFEGGFWLIGTTNTFRMQSCVADRNFGHGFDVDGDVPSATFQDCTSERNSLNGFRVAGDYARLIACSAYLNQRAGFDVQSTANRTKLMACLAEGNNQSNAGFPSFDIAGTNTQLNSCISEAGAQTTKPSYGYVVRATGTGTRGISCDAGGTHGTGNYVDLTSGTSAFFAPIPGVAKGAANPDTSGAAVATLEVEVNQLKALLRSYGMLA